MIRSCNQHEFETIWKLINDAARVYEGVIPSDRWKDPYMSKAELQHEIDEGVAFWCYEEGGEPVGVMGVQRVEDVSLIRHAYVHPTRQREGIGGRLLSRLLQQTELPTLIGTWADAVWAVQFYQRHGFRLVSPGHKERLLRRYWSIPERQVETSVVLADQRWFDRERLECKRDMAVEMSPSRQVSAPECLIRFCGADCSQCESYELFLTGDDSGLVNPQTGYRCCWLPAGYPGGRNCPIKTCCEQRAIPFCGKCDQLSRCERMQAFYAQPGYDALKRRMFEAIERREKGPADPAGVSDVT